MSREGPGRLVSSFGNTQILPRSELLEDSGDLLKQCSSLHFRYHAAKSRIDEDSTSLLLHQTSKQNQKSNL